MEENKNLKTEIEEAEENPIEKNEIMEAESADNGGEASDNEKKAGRSMVGTRNGLYLRAVIGGLILYYAYTIIADIGTASGTSRIWLYIFVAVFGIAGVWIILDSLKRLFKKEYDE
ncbi:MAG: hypothetical protein HDR00_11515 [Lachnospiraceae bacterium]|nr:hypothetical protein [Lachnospiraceae bacterium]